MSGFGIATVIGFNFGIQRDFTFFAIYGNATSLAIAISDNCWNKFSPYHKISDTVLMEVGSISGNAFLEVAVTMSLKKAMSLGDESSSFVVRLLAICRLATKEIVSVFVSNFH